MASSWNPSRFSVRRPTNLAWSLVCKTQERILKILVGFFWKTQDFVTHRKVHTSRRGVKSLPSSRTRGAPALRHIPHPLIGIQPLSTLSHWKPACQPGGRACMFHPIARKRRRSLVSVNVALKGLHVPQWSQWGRLCHFDGGKARHVWIGFVKMFDSVH